VQVAVYVKVAKQAQGSNAVNTVDTNIQAYLNPGAWTRGRTDFALVSGSDIVIYSLAPPPNDTRRVRGTNAYAEEQIKDTPAFRLVLALKDGPFPNIYFQGGYKPPTDFLFTEPDELILFVPDMHINLFRGTAIDGFVTAPRPGKLAESNISILAAFLDAISTFREKYAGRYKLQVIQMGDLMDVWIAQGVFLMAARYLEEKKEAARKNNEPLDRISYCYNEITGEMYHSAGQSKFPNYERTRTVTFADWPKQANAFDAWMLCLFYLKAEKEAKKEDLWPFLPHQSVVDRLLKTSLDYSVLEQVEESIMKMYAEEMKESQWNLLLSNRIRGNHDMKGDSSWLRDRHTHDLSDLTYSVKQAWNLPPWQRWDDEKVEGKGYNRRIGKDQCIWYEHGHSFDPYNHREVWYREDRKPLDSERKLLEPPLQGGFQSTLGTISDKVAAIFSLATQKKMETFDYAGDIGLEYYCYNRQARVFLKYAKSGPPVHLVVLAHTHVPHVEDWANYYDWLHPASPPTQE
jgi:hypothetical protein